jgi:hypothetical protein
MNKVDHSPPEFKGRNLEQIGLVPANIGGVLSVLVNLVPWTRVSWWRWRPAAPGKPSTRTNRHGEEAQPP